MAELIDPSNYQDFTLQTIMTPDGITRINNILRQLSQNIAGDMESVRVFSGVGTPEASLAAGVGSLYMRTDGGADTSVYRKETGSGNTGWVAVKSPASLPLSTTNGGLGVDASGWTAGDILYLSATGVIGHTSPLRIQTFTSSGTFVAPVGVTRVYLSMVGAGGGGGASTGGTSGSGGGAGGFIINAPYTVIAGNSYTITLNNGGSGGINSGAGTNGGDGGTTVFDSLSMPGGLGGLKNGGTAGAGSGGLNASSGTAGGQSIAGGTGGTGGAGAGGGGGGTPFGPGATGVIGTPINATANSGAGGAGGNATVGSGDASNGAKGICIVIY